MAALLGLPVAEDGSATLGDGDFTGTVATGGAGDWKSEAKRRSEKRHSAADTKGILAVLAYPRWPACFFGPLWRGGIKIIVTLYGSRQKGR